MKKNLQHNLSVAKGKSVKEASLKEKLKKNTESTAKPAIKNSASIAKIESKETIPNTSDGTLETRHIDTQEFNKSGPFQIEQPF